MKRNVMLLSSFFSIALEASHQNFVAMDKWHGRFGDQLRLYAKAKTVSYLLGIPYLHRPFLFSNLLLLEKEEKKCPPLNCFDRVISIHKIADLYTALERHKVGRTLYLIHFFIDVNPFKLPEEERNKLRKYITPLKPVKQMPIPYNTETVAIHIREVEANHRRFFGIKGHNLRYYIERLESLLEHHQGKSFYVHVFTDNAKPGALIEKIKRNISRKIDTNFINFGCSSPKNQTSSAIIADFFNMAHFDYLIRPFGSGFSIMAQFIGRHKKIFSLTEKDATLPPLEKPLTRQKPCYRTLKLTKQ